MRESGQRNGRWGGRESDPEDGSVELLKPTEDMEGDRTPLG